jgi:hypothetical protein
MAAPGLRARRSLKTAETAVPAIRVKTYVAALGVLIMSALQANKPELAREIVQKAGVRHRPEDLGYTLEEIDRTLLALRGFVKRERLWHSIASDLVIGERELASAHKAVDF